MFKRETARNNFPLDEERENARFSYLPRRPFILSVHDPKVTLYNKTSTARPIVTEAIGISNCIIYSIRS